MYILAFQQQWHSTCPQGRRLSTRLDAIGGGPEWNAPSDLKSDLTETSLRIRSCLAVIGFEQNHAPTVTQDDSSTPVRALPFNAIATILGDRGLMGGLAFLDPTDDVAFGCFGGIPGGRPEQQPVSTGALIHRHVVTIPTPRQLQAVVQALKLAAEENGHAGFTHTVEADLLPISGQGLGQIDLHREVAPLPAFLRKDA